MIVVVAYAPGLLHRRVVPAVRRQGVEPRLLELHGITYPLRLLELFDEMAEKDEPLCVIEQDVEIRYGALAGFEECPEPWCFHAYPFSVPYDETGLTDWFSPLGCTRFRPEIAPVLQSLRENPEFTISWVGRDVWTSRVLADAGYRSHRHPGDMMHYHDYNERPAPPPPPGTDALVEQGRRLAAS